MKYFLGFLTLLMLSGCDAPKSYKTVDVGDITTPDTPVPTVQNLQVFSVSETEVILRWSDNNQAEGYKVRRNGNTIATIAKGLFTFTDSEIIANTTYRYDVVAINENGRESPVQTISITAKNNNAPVISTQIGKLQLLDTALLHDLVAVIEASDLDNDALTYSLKVNQVESQEILSIDDNGQISMSVDAATLAGKVLNLQVEVSDSFSISSMQFQLGFIPTIAGAANQGLSRNVYSHASIANDLAVLKELPIYPNSPTSTSIETRFQSPSQIGNNYGQRMQGYLVPALSGDYQFWIAADDSAELSISSNHQQENLEVIATLASHTAELQWDRYNEQASAMITLEAGKAYAIEALMVEGGGGDHLAVAWQGPGIDQQVIANEYLRLPVDFETPTAISDLTWLKTAEDKVMLQWKAAIDNLAVDHYEIYNEAHLLETTQDLSIELTGLESAKRYNLTVRAVDAAGNQSIGSNSVGIVIDDYLAPSIITSLNANEQGTDYVNLQWDASSDERNQDVLYRVFQNDVLIGQNYQTQFAVKSLLPATAYDFTVEALDASGNSAGLSTVLTVTTESIVEGTPVFDFPSYEFALSAASLVNTVFASLAYQADAVPSFSISAGNDAGYFTVSEQGQLSLAKAFSSDTDQGFELTVAVVLGEVSTTTQVKIKAIASSRFSARGVLQQVWTGQGGSSIADINTQAVIQSQQVLASFKSPTSMGNNYAQKVSGYLAVPESGEYSFWIASDDASQFKISPDMTAEKAQLVAHVNGYTSEDNWSNGSQAKTNLQLNAGQLYYVEVMHKEGGGGDHMSVAWQGPSINKTQLLGEYLYPLSSFYPAPTKLETAFQSNFAQAGNEIQLEISLEDIAAGFPFVIYYGAYDAGESQAGWQYTLELGDLTAGNHTLTLPNIAPGTSYYIRVETQGPAGSSWAPNVLQVDTVVIDESKTVGEALPETLSLTVLINEEEQLLELSKHSVRSPNFQLLTYDDRRIQHFQALVPMPEVRTYRGFISNNPFVTVTGVVDAAGTIHLSAWGGDSRQWGQTVDISDQINSDALGNSDASSDELIIDFEMPEAVDNQFYLSQPGSDFHNNLSRVAFTFRNSQFNNRAEGNLINGLAQMEGHINELDYVWAQKTGLRWDIGNSIIEVNGALEDATQSRPAATDSTTFRMTFQDPRNGGYCWGGGDWLGCVANYTMNWGFTHEVGHNFGLGHGEQTDNNNQIQQPSTHMGSMQARKTTARLQRYSKFKAAKALTNPMLPATFKDYLTVYQDQAGIINPLANDYDANGDELSLDSFEATTLAGGAVTNSNGTLTYIPPAGFVGVDQFSYVASDGQYKTRGPVQIQVLNNGLTAHWDMDTLVTKTINEQPVELVEDLSGQGNDLSAPDLASITPSVSLADVQVVGSTGQGLSIPLMASAVKANDAIGHSLLPHKLDPGHKSFTASMWFKYSAIDGNKLLIGKSSSGPNNMQYGGWEIRSEGTKLEMQVSYRDRLMNTNTAVAEQTDALVDGNWHHVVMVIDRENNELRGYLDGSPLTTQTDLPLGEGPIMAAMNSSGYGGGSPFRVGGHTAVDCIDAASEGDPQICTVRDGQAFDSIKIYHQALTDAQVTGLFNE